jgi:hypothetical protein
MRRWPKDLDFSITDPTYKLDQMARECQRYGVGLGTFHPYFNSYRVRPRIDAVRSTPDDEDVEARLDCVFSRNGETLKQYNERVQVVQKQLIEGLTR